MDEEVEVPINIILGTNFIAQLPYKMAPLKMVELKIQL